MIQALRKQLLSVNNKAFSTYLLKNAKVVNADISETADVLIEGKQITAVGSNLTHKNA